MELGSKGEGGGANGMGRTLRGYGVSLRLALHCLNDGIDHFEKKDPNIYILPSLTLLILLNCISCCPFGQGGRLLCRSAMLCLLVCCTKRGLLGDRLMMRIYS